MHVLVCGGGVIGASIAYFLSERGVRVTVAESTGVANAASGKSGGFLARDWCEGSPLAPLAHRSFDLHAELAARIENDWGYRRMETFGGHVGFMRRSEGPSPVRWLSSSISGSTCSRRNRTERGCGTRIAGTASTSPTLRSLRDTRCRT